MDKKKIIDLIAEYRLEKAFEEAIALFPQAHNHLIALKARHSKINHEYFISYIINDSDYNLEVNRIIVGFLQLLDEATVDNPDIKDHQFFHALHRFPRGPMVPLERISKEIISTYAELIESQQSGQVILEARNFRLEADNDEKVTAIKLIDLPPPNTVAPIDFWRRAFHISCLHGPRMLGALLLVVSDEQFSQKTKKARRDLINFLESMWNQ